MAGAWLVKAVWIESERAACLPAASSSAMHQNPRRAFIVFVFRSVREKNKKVLVFEVPVLALYCTNRELVFEAFTNEDYYCST